MSTFRGLGLFKSHETFAYYKVKHLKSATLIDTNNDIEAVFSKIRKPVNKLDLMRVLSTDKYICSGGFFALITVKSSFYIVELDMHTDRLIMRDAFTGVVVASNTFNISNVVCIPSLFRSNSPDFECILNRLRLFDLVITDLGGTSFSFRYEDKIAIRRIIIHYTNVMSGADHTFALHYKKGFLEKSILDGYSRENNHNSLLMGTVTIVTKDGDKRVATVKANLVDGFVDMFTAEEYTTTCFNIDRYTHDNMRQVKMLFYSCINECAKKMGATVSLYSFKPSRELLNAAYSTNQEYKNSFTAELLNLLCTEFAA